MKMPLIAFALSTVLVGGAVFAEDNTLSAEEKDAGWELLFDGKSAENFKNFKRDKLSPKWIVEDGELKKTPGGGDIITTKSL